MGGDQVGLFDRHVGIPEIQLTPHENMAPRSVSVCCPRQRNGGEDEEEKTLRDTNMAFVRTPTEGMIEQDRAASGGGLHEKVEAPFTWVSLSYYNAFP